MERRRRLRARQRELLLSWLRPILVVLLLAGCYFGVRYVLWRSDKEVAAIKNRQESEYYLIVDQPLTMTVVNDSGQLAMEISGKKVYLTTDQRTAIFEEAHAVYYENNQPSLTMDAGRIQYDTQTEDFLLTDGLKIQTKDGMFVESPEVTWRAAKNAGSSRGTKVPAFAFAKGVKVWNQDGNLMQSDYMQADRELMYMEFVGHVNGFVAALQDTSFIRERKITDVEQLKLQDFEKLNFESEQLIYDKANQVVLATSRYYDRSFKVLDLDGNEVKVETYEKEQKQVHFSKAEIDVLANHLEAHIAQKWADCIGNITMVIPPAQPKANDDKALQVVKKYSTSIAAAEVEYFWGHDYVLTHGRTRVEQQDRLALADQITYWGEQRQVLLDGNITVVQGSGQWLFDADLVRASDHDMRRALETYSELYGDRAVIYLNNNDFIASGNVLVRQDEREIAADTIVYQDTIKRITARSNVKFHDVDGQTFLCGALVFNDESKFLQVESGALASIRLPAKYANDINRALAQAREEPVPAEITDPAVPASVTRNPNSGSTIRSGVTPSAPANVPSVPPATGGKALPPLTVPGEDTGAPPSNTDLFIGPLQPPAEPADSKQDGSADGDGKSSAGGAK